MKKLFILAILLATSQLAIAQWVTYPTQMNTANGKKVSIGPFSEDVYDNINQVTLSGKLGIYNGEINFHDFEGGIDRKISGNSADFSMYFHQNSTFRDGPGIALYSDTHGYLDDARGINFFVNSYCNGGSSGGRTAFAFTALPSTLCTDPTPADLFLITREADAFLGGSLTAGAGITAASAKFSNLATGTGKMVVADQYGQLNAWELPYLVLNGSSLSLRTQGTNYSTITLPAGADNLSLSGSTLSLRSGATTLSSVTLPNNSTGIISAIIPRRMI